MNANGLEKMYGKLAPLERLQLNIAAWARGDLRECDRLVQSAPRITRDFVDDWPLLMALNHVATVHLLKLVDLVAHYFQILGAATYKPTESRPRLGTVVFIGAVFRARLAGWRQFCEDLGVDPQMPWSGLAGSDLVVRFEKITDAAASDYDVPIFLATDGEHVASDAEGRHDAERFTAETDAAKLMANWREFVELCGG